MDELSGKAKTILIVGLIFIVIGLVLGILVSGSIEKAEISKAVENGYTVAETNNSNSIITQTLQSDEGFTTNAAYQVESQRVLGFVMNNTGSTQAVKYTIVYKNADGVEVAKTINSIPALMSGDFYVFKVDATSGLPSDFSTVEVYANAIDLENTVEKLATASDKTSDTQVYIQIYNSTDKTLVLDDIQFVFLNDDGNIVDIVNSVGTLDLPAGATKCSILCYGVPQ